MTPELLAIIVLIGAFVILIANNVPIAFSIGASTVLSYLCLWPGRPLLVFMQVAKDMWHGVDSYALLAIPMFILSGLLMGSGGIARRLVEFADVLFGPLRGGLCFANVCACMLFGAISGSATAAASSIGAFMIPEMRRAGYNREFSTALTLSAATLGLVIPPSNVMIVYAVAWGDAGGRSVDVGALFMGGFIPGVIIAAGLMAVAAVHAVRAGVAPTGTLPWREGLTRFRRAALSLLLMVIVLGGIMGGFFTATQASAAAVVYSFILAVFVYKKVAWRDLPGILKTTAVTTAFIFMLIASSKAMGNLMVRLDLPQTVSAALIGLTDNRYILLLVINLILLFVGAFMDMTPAVLIFTPIFSSVAVGVLHMHPIHFGLIMIVNLCIGLCTPPVGTVLFVGCGVGGTTITRLIRPMLPFYASMVATLFIITYLPEDVILWLPRLISPNV
ncbi:MAG: TRAP transporter large permease subunit [bacterium]|nr:TRAP transporter large permease subunit [bacterium]